MNTTFYIVRHGQTDWNVQKRLQGQTNTPLNTVGKKQAKRIAEKLKDVHFDAVYSSDLDRAYQTAEFMAMERELTIKTTKALREKSFGSYEGSLRKNVREDLKHIFAKWELLSNEEKMKYRLYSDGETDHEAVERFIRHLRELAIAHEGESVLIATHGGVMRYFLIKLGWATYDNLDSHSIKNTAYIKVESDGVDFFLQETYMIEKTKFN